MRAGPPALTLFLLAGTPPALAAGGPAAAVRAAAADVARVPEGLRPHARYLSLCAVPQEQRADFLRALSYHVHSLSRESEVVRPVAVADGLVRVNLLDYGWKTATFEKLARHDPYFHANLVKETTSEATEYEDRTERVWDPYRGWVEVSRRVPVAEQAKKKETVLAHAPWLPAAEIAALAKATHSEAPVLRADWFLYWTAIQKDRGGAGYYDFLGLKSRADLERLAGLDVAAARRLRKEMAAVVSESGVALNNRQVFRYQALSGGWWVTLDVEKSTDEKDGQGKLRRRNALRNLNGDFDHDAEEIYAVLPSGMFATIASDARGNLQEVVPPSIALDHAATSNDRNIYAGTISCTRCHVEGLRPIDDHARKLYRGPVQLASPDYEKLKRLRQLYLSDLPRQLERDRQDYAEALLKVNGLTPPRNAALYAAVWRRYAETSLGTEEAALELGVTPEVLVRALKGYAAAGSDPALAGLLADPPLRVRREQWHELYPLAQQVLARHGGGG